LALTLGRQIDGILGPDVPDKSGAVHCGITTIPIPILRTAESTIKEIRLRVAKDADQDLFIVDFTDAAQSTRTYDEYTQKISGLETEELRYLAIALYGPKKIVQRLTGSLPLMR
jgi:hypothetical protein